MENDSGRKTAILNRSEKCTATRESWREKASFFHREDERYLRFSIPEGARVLEIGCGTGDTLAVLKPYYGVGIDCSAGMIAQAKPLHPELEFHVGDAEDAETINALKGPFDFILVQNTIGSRDDCQAFLAKLHSLCVRHTRIVIVYFSRLRQPVLRLAKATAGACPIWSRTFCCPMSGGACGARGYESCQSGRRLLMPVSLFGIGRLINRFISVSAISIRSAIST